MSKTVVHAPVVVVLLAATCLFGCSDQGPLEPTTGSPAANGSALAFVQPADVTRGDGASPRAPDLGTCTNLQVPAGNTLALRVYAQGVQIYNWNGTTWTFSAPEAVMTADVAGKGMVGTHYAGPTWESLSGSKVIGTVEDRCTPDPSAIPWLRLRTVSATGPGIFRRVTFIQRVNTVGGLAPSEPGAVIGEEARVPYTTEYLFYREH
jgi:hypothetical protein